MEVSRRRGDFAMMGVACTVRLDAEGRCAQARIALCNAGDGPVFAAQASESLVGGAIDAARIADAAKLVQGEIEPGGSIHASKEFQRHLAGVLITRTLTMADQRARRDH
jgi:CO/xanthine dehydrogenase FAD-binding subunit